MGIALKPIVQLKCFLGTVVLVVLLSYLPKYNLKT